MRIGTRTSRVIAAVAVVGGLGGASGEAAQRPAAVAVAAGLAHTCALTGGGAVLCWGENGHDELGDGSAGDGVVSSPRPVRVVGLQSGVTQISAGTRHSCALLRSARVACWGANYGGALGDGTDGRHPTPARVAGLTDATAVAAGYDHSCALTAAGGVVCWGSNSSGEVGDGTTSDRWKPVPVTGLGSGVTAVAAGALRSCALTSAGAVECWGNGFGPTPRAVSGLSGATAITTSCGLVTGGSVRCWTGSSGGVSEIPNLRSAATIAGGRAFGCALTNGGGVWCWGENDHGQLGDGTKTSRPAAAPVTGLRRGMAAIAANVVDACAVTSSGALKCWGSNGVGELGDGTTVERSKPVLVLGFGARAVAAVASRTVRVSSAGIATLELRCGSRLRCDGVAALRRGGSTVGDRRFSIPPSREKGVRIRLRTATLRLLVGDDRLAARVQLVLRQPDGGTTRLTRRVVLVAPRR